MGLMSPSCRPVTKSMGSVTTKTMLVYTVFTTLVKLVVFIPCFWEYWFAVCFAGDWEPFVGGAMV